MEYLNHRTEVVTAVDEFDFFERIKPSAILQYFQDAATVHATEIGIGYEQMKAQNLCWVLNRLSAVIDKSPALGEEITVTTYPHKPGMVDAFRDYYVTDREGNSLIRGTSRWCVLDIGNKSVRRCAPMFGFDDSVYKPEYAVENGNIQLPQIDKIDGECVTYTDTVKITDLDRNGHMNNARYADIIVNCCDFGFYSSHSIKAFDFNFLSELKIGNTYCVKSKMQNGVSYFEANSNDKSRAVFRAAIKWQ